jgi:hypothetical protein
LKAANHWRLFAFAGRGVSLAAANQNAVWVMTPTAAYPFSAAAWAMPPIAVGMITSVIIVRAISFTEYNAEMWATKSKANWMGIGGCGKADCESGSGGESDEGLFHGAFLSF